MQPPDVLLRSLRQPGNGFRAVATAQAVQRQLGAQVEPLGEVTFTVLPKPSDMVTAPLVPPQVGSSRAGSSNDPVPRPTSYPTPATLEPSLELQLASRMVRRPAVEMVYIRWIRARVEFPEFHISNV